MLKKNILANLVGKGVSAVLAVVFVPLYLKYLGAEAYGFVGIFVLLQSIFVLADIGLSGAFSREVAKLPAIGHGARDIRDLCHTLEIVLVVIGLLSATVIGLLSNLIAEHWVNLQQFSTGAASRTLILVGVAVGLQFPFLFYQGGLQGLQRQALVNGLIVGLATLRGFGAVFILKFVSPAIDLFFMWQIIIGITQLVVGHVLIWQSLPSGSQPRFRPRLIRPLWRFALGTAGGTLMGILLTQSDKLVLTRMLTLEEFGYYTLAGVFASVPGMIAFSISGASYPRFVQLVSTRNFRELSSLYHRSCQLMSALILPVGMVLALFSHEIILLWSGSDAMAQHTYVLASILVVGATLMTLLLLPHALQLAYGWVSLGLYVNIAGVLLLVPLLIWLASRYGAIGACVVSVVLYGIQLIVVINLMHRRLLRREKWHWYLQDVAKPFLASLLVVVSGRLLVSETGMGGGLLVAAILAALVTATLAASMSAPALRCIIAGKLGEYRRTRRAY